MPIDFPTSPSINEIYSIGTKAWIWTGSAWRLYSPTAVGSSINNDTTTNQNYFPAFMSANTGTATTVLVSSSKLTYNPSTGTLSSVEINTTSDVKYKENVEPIDSAISILNEINGVSFNWKETGVKSYGIIAQELQRVLPELVKQNEQGLSVSYLPLIAILIEAVKEQQKQIEELKSRV